MRLLPSVAVALLTVTLTVASLSACAPPAPTADTVTSAASTTSSVPRPVGDLPSPPGVLPAPQQREPVPAVTGSGAAAGPETVPPASAPATTPARSLSPSPVPSPSATAAAAGLHTDPGAVDVVVNKRRPLAPLDYAPADLRRPDVATATDNALLRPDAATAVEELFAAAGDDGVGLVVVSGYRSYANQESTYASWVGEYGDASGADTVSARPGYSEHQTGLAFDIGQADGACTLVLCFRDTPAAQWAAANAADFGIILRYPQGFDGITGFSAESWHFRYVGRDTSLAMRAAGTQTLEEYFGLPPAPSY
jgi:D-alanyl-D-alanine carboxypeptidase